LPLEKPLELVCKELSEVVSEWLELLLPAAVDESPRRAGGSGDDELSICPGSFKGKCRSSLKKK
jgi:hypothetical protein